MPVGIGYGPSQVAAPLRNQLQTARTVERNESAPTNQERQNAAARFAGAAAGNFGVNQPTSEGPGQFVNFLA